MANTLVYGVQWNNDEGDFVNGDQIQIYYDPDLDPTPGVDPTTGFSVFKNGLQIYSGSNFQNNADVDPNIQTQNFDASICNGTTLVKITPVNDFPYVNKVLFPDSPSCAIDVVCDLIFIGVPEITDASSPTTQDGIIDVVATSSQAIQYKLDDDFTYGDGTNNGTGGHFIVYPGDHRIYVRDANNCKANIFVTVPVATSFAARFELEYEDSNGFQSRIRVIKNGYVGDTEIVKGSGNPIQLRLRGEAEVDKFAPTIPTEATVTFIAETDGQFEELYTNSPKQYRVTYEKDFGSGYVMKWTGNIVPQQYQSEIKIDSEVSFVAKDGLNDLENIDFVQDDGQLFFGRTKAIALIAYCLKKTLLNLNIRCGCNIFASTMIAGVDNDPLDQAYIDPDAFNLLGNPNYNFVLTEILRPFRAQIRLWEGVWNIIRPEEMWDIFNYREFNPAGIYLDHDSYAPIVDVDVPEQTDCLKWMAFPNKEIRPGYGKGRIIYHLGLKTNILRNGDFRLKSTFDTFFNNYIYSIDKFGFQLHAPYGVSESAEILDATNVAYVMSSAAAVTTGQAYLLSDEYFVAMGSDNTLKLTIRYKLPQPYRYGLGTDDDGHLTVFTQPTTLHYQKVRMVVKYGSRYLQSDGSWTAFPSECVVYATQFGQYLESIITATQPDVTYTTEKTISVKIYQSWPNHTEFTTLADLKGKPTNAGSIRANYDASSDLFPAAGGSGGGGSIQEGDKFPISVAGRLGGIDVAVGWYVVALVDLPGQTSTNWFITNSGVGALPTGTKTELLLGSLIYYYELEENTTADDDSAIIRPTDYNAVTNPVQWIFKARNDIAQNQNIIFYLDAIILNLLTDGKDTLDAIIREQAGEANNNLVLEEEVYLGSLSSLIQTNLIVAVELLKSRGVSIGGSTQEFKLPRVSKFLLTQNILSGKVIYAGFLSDYLGVGYDRWTRVGQPESLTLHEIFLLTTMAQYLRSWAKISGSLTGDVNAGFLTTLRYEDILYLPSAMTINDKVNQYDVESNELVVPTEGGRGFTTGFTIGHNA